MWIIKNCFYCPDSKFNISTQKWICLPHNKNLTDLNLTSEIPMFCSSKLDFFDINFINPRFIDPRFVDPRSQYQENRLLIQEMIEALSKETKLVLQMIFNSPSEIINNISSVIVGKSNYSRNRKREKYTCHYCNRKIREGEKCYTGRLREIKHGSIKFCSRCKDKYNLTEEKFICNITEQTLAIGMRNKFGWKHRVIYKIIKELRIIPGLL